MGRRCVSIEEYVAPMSACCKTVYTDTRHARVRPRPGMRGSQHQPLLHAVFRSRKRLGVPRQGKKWGVGSISPRTEASGWTCSSYFPRRGFRDAPSREFRSRSRSCSTFFTKTRKRGYPCVGAALLVVDQLPLHPNRAKSVSTALYRDKCTSTKKSRKTRHLRDGKLRAPQVRR